METDIYRAGNGNWHVFDTLGGGWAQFWIGKTDCPSSNLVWKSWDRATSKWTEFSGLSVSIGIYNKR